MKVTVLLGLELLGKLLIVGALLFGTFKASLIAGSAMVAGYLVYNLAAHFIEKEKEKAGAELINKLYAQYSNQTGTGGGNC